MKKSEYRVFHEFMEEVTTFMKDQGLNVDTSEYDDEMSVTPTDIHKSKSSHVDAFESLMEAALETIERETEDEPEPKTTAVATAD